MINESKKYLSIDLSAPSTVAILSVGLGLFSLFGYIPIIFLLALPGALAYLFASVTRIDVFSLMAIVLLWIIPLVSIISGLGAIILGIKALFQKNIDSLLWKCMAVLGVFLGVLGVLYHAYTFLKV